MGKYTPKNLNTQVMAKRNTEKVVNVRFVIAGDGPDLPRMKDDAAKLVLVQIVAEAVSRFYPGLKYTEKPTDYQLCLEKFPPMLIEAAGYTGLMVKLLCGPTDIVKNGETGWLCEIDALAITQTCELLQDETLCQR